MQQIKCTRTLFRKNDKFFVPGQQPQNDLIIKTCDKVGVQTFKQALFADVSAPKLCPNTSTKCTLFTTNEDFSFF